MFRLGLELLEGLGLVELKLGLGLGLLKVTRYKTFKPLKSPLQLEVDPI